LSLNIFDYLRTWLGCLNRVLRWLIFLIFYMCTSIKITNVKTLSWCSTISIKLKTFWVRIQSSSLLLEPWVTTANCSYLLIKFCVSWYTLNTLQTRISLKCLDLKIDRRNTWLNVSLFSFHKFKWNKFQIGF
jgi:hypothetical protein